MPFNSIRRFGDIAATRGTLVSYGFPHNALADIYTIRTELRDVLVVNILLSRMGTLAIFWRNVVRFYSRL